MLHFTMPERLAAALGTWKRGAAVLLAALLPFSALSVSNATAEESGLQVPASLQSPRIFQLKNGLTVGVLEDERYPLASVRLFVNAGSAWETAPEAGMSHLLEHMVFKGSKSSPQGVDRTVENAGGYLNASTSYDETIYLTDLPSKDWKTAVRSIRDLAFDPLLRQSDLDAELPVVLAEMKQRGDSPWTRLYHESFALAFKGTPYEHPVIGYEKELRAMTPDSIRAYIQRRYDPRGMTLFVVGKVKAEEVVAEAEKLFGAYENLNTSVSPEAIDPAALVRGRQIKVIEGPWQKSIAALTFPMPGENDALQPAAEVLSRMMAGDDSTVLPRALRVDKHVVDMVGAMAFPLRRVGSFMLVAQMDADKALLFTEETARYLNGLKASSFSDDELRRAKLNIEDDFYRAQETVAGRASLYGEQLFHHPADPDASRYLESIRHVSREEIQSVIDAWLKPEALNMVLLTPADGQSAAREQQLRQTLNNLWPEKEQGQQEQPQNCAAACEDEIIELGKGRTVVLRHDRHLPYLSMILRFEGGDALASELKDLDLLKKSSSAEGLAPLTASVLSSASATRDYRAMNTYLSERAAAFSASASSRHFVLSFDTPKRFSADLFALTSDILHAPAFSDEDISRNRREYIASIVSQKDSAEGILSRNLFHTLFPDTFYAYRSNGSEENIAAISRDDMLKFWQIQSSRPWVLAVGGDFDREEVLEFARSLPLPQEDYREARSSKAPAWGEQKELTLHLPGRQQGIHMMIFPTVPQDHPDSPALQLLSASLSGFNGMLHQELREKRSLGYSAAPMNMARQDLGMLCFMLIASPDNLTRGNEVFLDIARTLTTEELPADTLDRARAMLQANYYESLQSRSAMADSGASLVMRGLPLDFTQKRLEELDKLTPADLLKVARKYLKSDEAYYLTIRP